MSSPLSSMTCLGVEDRHCWIRIEPMQALTLPYSDAFALATLLEVYSGLVSLGTETLWAHQIVGPLAAALEAEARMTRVELLGILCDNPGGVEALVARYVSFRGYRDIAGFTVPAALRPDADGFYIATHWWTSARERDVAHRIVSDELAAWYAQFYAHEEEGGPPPRVVQPAITLVVEATRPEWLAHLRPGMGWDGYCFDDRAPAFP